MADKKVDTRVLANTLAKELGYKNLDDFKLALEKRTPKSLAGRLESGEGFGSAISKSISDKVSDVKENYLTGKGIKRNIKGAAENVYKEFFKGDDVFSAYMRGRLNKKTKQKAEETKGVEKESKGALGKEANVLLKIIAKNSLYIHDLSKDMNVLRQNIKTLVDVENSKGKKKNRRASIDEDINWFKKEDEVEAKLEAERQKFSGEGTDNKKADSTSPTQQGQEGEGGGFLGSLIGMLKNGLFAAFKLIFKPTAILKLLGKVFILATLFISLFKGITAAFDRWKETGSIKEALIAGLGAIVDFLTFGFFGEDTVRDLFNAAEQFIQPIVDSLMDTFNGVKDWIVNNVGIPEIPLPKIKIPYTNTTFDLGKIGPYYPFKSNPKSSSNEVTSKKGKEAPEKTKQPTKASIDDEIASQQQKMTNAGQIYGTLYSNKDKVKPEQLENAKKNFEEETKKFEELKKKKETQSNVDNKLANDWAYSVYTKKQSIEQVPETYRKPVEKILQNVPDNWKIKPESSSNPQQSVPVAPMASMESGNMSPSIEPSEKETSAPSMNTTPEPKTSGQTLSSESSSVAEAQRTEFVGETTGIINNAVTNNTSGTVNKSTSKVGEVYDTEFAEYYATT